MIYFMMLKAMRLLLLMLMACLSVAVSLSDDASGFKSSISEGEDCSKCHALTLEEASSIVKSINPDINVIGVTMGPIEGLWEIVIEARGQKGIAYIDFSKEHIVTGSVLKVSTRENLTSLRLYDLSKIDLSVIPLDEALVMGKKEARYKVVVFDDPD